MSKHVITATILFVLLAGCSREQPRQQASTPNGRQETAAMAHTQIPVFDGKAAFSLLERQTNFGPRNPNSAGHEACLRYLEYFLRQQTEQVELQPFIQTGYDETLKLTNIIAHFRPELTERVLLLAHWDTRPRAEHDPDKTKRNIPILGANDGASGVAVLLQLATMFHQQPPRIGVDLLLVDGEDYGKEGDRELYLLGARYFATHKPAGYAPRFGILLDMVGDTFLEIPREQYSLQYAPDVVNLVWTAARTLDVRQFIDGVGEQVIDDHLPLNEVGIKTIDLIDFNYPDQTNRYWHTLDDTPAHCSAASLEAVGKVLSHVVYTQEP